MQVVDVRGDPRKHQLWELRGETGKGRKPIQFLLCISFCVDVSQLSAEFLGGFQKSRALADDVLSASSLSTSAS